MTAPRPFTSVTMATEANLLRRLHGIIEAEGVASREDFGDLMKASFDHCRLDARKLSDDLGYSHTTVHRWIHASSAPHQSTWPAVIEWISRAILGRIAECEDAGGCRAAV